MAFIHPDISGMNFTRSKPFTGMGPQPHSPVQPLMRSERATLGNDYMKFTDESRPSPAYPHFHKRPEYGGKLAQSMDSKSAYYAMLSPKYCLRSSLTGLERHYNGVKILRECNNRLGPPVPPRSLTPDFNQIHSMSLVPWPRPGATKSMRTRTAPPPSAEVPEIERACSLHRGWQTNFDAKGGVVMLDPTAGGRDTVALAQETQKLIHAQHMHVRKVQEAARDAVLERASRIREDNQVLAR